jgi:hypothetical protein
MEELLGACFSTIVPVGRRCYTAMTLKHYGRRFQAYPFDAVISTLGQVALAIQDRFRN